MDRIAVMQLVRSFQWGQLGRREFLRRATLALGSAAAANLLLSACGSTPNESLPPVVEEESGSESAPAESSGELITETVNYEDTDGETLMGHLARPADGEARPAVVVLQEWWGLNDHIKDVANRFAEQGYVALAPDLYKGVVVTEPDEAMKQVMELDMEEAVREIQRAMAFLREQEYVSQPQVGVVGFCMGGGLALQTALAEEQLGAAIAFYGRPIDPAQASEVKAPVLGLYGAEDGGIAVADVEAMFAALEEAGIENEYHIYDGAQHAFFNDTRESYNAEAATDAWQQSLDWFGQQLQG